MSHMPVKKKRPIIFHMAWSLEKTKHSFGGKFIALNPFYLKGTSDSLRLKLTCVLSIDLTFLLLVYKSLHDV